MNYLKFSFSIIKSAVGLVVIEWIAVRELVVGLMTKVAYPIGGSCPDRN